MSSGRTYEIHNEDTALRVSLKTISHENGIEIVRVKVDFDRKRIPGKIKIEWAEPMVDTLFVWIPCQADRNMHQSWVPSCSASSFCSGAPVLTTIGENGMNRVTVAVSDAETPLTIRYYVDDFPQKYKVKYSVTFFEGMCHPMTEYEADIRIDTRTIPFYESVQEVYPWWRDYGYEIPAAPQAAEDALYSSWYNFHQSPQGDALLRDLTIASELGFRTVILDDGWQIEGKTHASYDDCGDWIVAKSKFPDFRAFADDVHRLGMKMMLWFAVPYVGEHSEAYRRFTGKYLYDCGGFWTLDPRYPEVREYLKDICKRFLTEYDIDGFKLDFIDSFRPGDCTAEYNGQMDFETVGDAVKRLLTEIADELGQIKKDLLYEYRQFYIGPAVNRFGNMLRAGDCAYDAHINRRILLDLRLLGYPVAVHSDMLYWSKDESIALCARQLLNILFAVPQISVILADSTEEQKRLLRRYLAYWTENRELLLHGKLHVFHPEMNYSQASAENADKIITVLYADIPYVFTGKTTDVLHNGDRDDLYIENGTGSPARAMVFDCFGNRLTETTVAGSAVTRINVPKAGMITLQSERCKPGCGI